MRQESGDIIGALSVALAIDYVTGPWSDMRSSLVGLTAVLIAAIVGWGAYTSDFGANVLVTP